MGELILVFIGVINFSLTCSLHPCRRQFTNDLSKYVNVSVTISNYVEQCCWCLAQDGQYHQTIKIPRLQMQTCRFPINVTLGLTNDDRQKENYVKLCCL